MAKLIYANTGFISEEDARGISLLFHLTYVRKVSSSCFALSGTEQLVDYYLSQRLYPKTSDWDQPLISQVVFTRFPLPEQHIFFNIVNGIAAFSDGNDDPEEAPNVASTISSLPSPSLKSKCSPNQRPKSIRELKDLGFSLVGSFSIPKASPPAETASKVEQGNIPHTFVQTEILEWSVASPSHPEVAARNIISSKDQGFSQADSTSYPEGIIFSRGANLDAIGGANPPKKRDDGPLVFFDEEFAKKAQHNEYKADGGAKQVGYQKPAELLVFDESDFAEQKISEFTDVSRFPERHPIYMREWNPQAWLVTFKKYQEIISSSRSREIVTAYSIYVKCMRVVVMLNTLKYIREGEYRPSSGAKQLVRRLNTQTTMIYEKIPNILESFRLQETTKVKVVNEDCLVVAQKAKSRNPSDRVCVLNMTSALGPGGGYKKGEGGQEDSIMRRTNYCTALDSTWDSANPNAGEKPRDYHVNPLGGAYTRSVTVFRDTEDKGYELLSQPFECDFVAAYASRHEKDRPFNEGDVTVTLQKIRAIFGMAVENRANVLVLGAFGCGADRNDPGIVVQCFESALQEFGSFFKQVIFAVVDKSANQENYRAFQALHDNMYTKPKIPSQFSRSFCADGGRCPKIDDDGHWVTSSHPSVCPDQKCKNHDTVHRIVFSHLKIDPTKHDLQQNAGKHDNPTHGDLAICELEGLDYWCSDAYNTQKTHYLHCRHTCRFGSKCREINNPEHNRLYIHKALPPCPLGENCTNVNDYRHRQSQSHPTLPDILIPCRSGNISLCPVANDSKHILQYKHMFN